MEIRAEQQFELPLAEASQARALAFVQSPEHLLARLRFLQDVQVRPDGVRGELVVQIPALDRVDLPFCSRLKLLPTGAALEPLPLAQERAWVEVAGQATVSAHSLSFHFEFVAHLALPDMPGWGGTAFEKMVVAAAGRTLERVAQELPRGVAEAWAEFKG